MRFLVVEDQKKMAAFLKKGLEEAGYSVDWAANGAETEDLVLTQPYDFVILDVMLPDANGMELARKLRKDGMVCPILMLTAVGGTQDKVRGLDSGADDYLTKPFSFDELLARIRALLRRKEALNSDSPSRLKFEDLEMDLVTRTVSRAQKPIQLTQKEFSLLEYFLRNPNRPISRTSISEHVWDIHFDSESNVIDVYVAMLRKKIDHPQKTKLIHTVVGVGYVLKKETK